MNRKKWWMLGGALGMTVLAVVLILVLGGVKESSWTQIPEPGRDNLNPAEIPGFVPGANAPGREQTKDSRNEGVGQTAASASDEASEADGKKPAERVPAASEKPGPGKDGAGNEKQEDTGTKPPDPGEESTEITEPQGYRLSDDCLTLASLGGYSGNYLEDGTDELVSNVAAILVTNNGDRMLQVAEITFQVNETEQAMFRITDLPAGATALVLEQNRRPYRDADDYTYGRTASGYIDPPSLEEERFELDTSTVGKLTLKNLTEETFGKVYVYYKYVQVGGVYLGGITYRVPFEDIPASGTVESLAGHFSPDNSRIMAVVVMPE